MDILDRIDPHLTSEDVSIRNFALYAIRSFPAFKTEWPERLIRAAIADQDNAVSYLVPLENRLLGDSELSLLVEALHVKELKYPHLFLNVLKRIPLEVKIANREKIGALLPDEEWTFLLALNDAGKEELHVMLQKILETLEKDEYNHALYARAKQIAHRQVALGFEEAAELRRMINRVPEDHWLNFNEIIAIYKLGLLKDLGAIPELANLFARPEDLMQEELADALIAFQSDEVVQAVESYARSKDATFPITVIAKTYSPLAVATLKGLYADSDNLDDQSFIIQGLAEQLAPAGRPEIEDFMSQKKLPAILNNEEMAYGYFKVLELDHPGLERWKQIVQDHHEHMLKLRDEPLDAAFERFLKSVNPKTQAVSDKVGRNDPCPCGSGKKYKKCHGK